MKSKKLLLGSLTAMATVAAPIATVVSCGVGVKSLTTKIEAVKGLEDDKVKLEDYKKELEGIFTSVKGEDGKDISTKDIEDATTKKLAKAAAILIVAKAFPADLKAEAKKAEAKKA